MIETAVLGNLFGAGVSAFAGAALSPALLLAEALVLVSWWKPVLLLIPLAAWAYIVAVVLDKHAARFHLGRDGWNAIHLAVGAVAFLGVMLIPGDFAFFIALPVLILVLAGEVVAFGLITNRDERVPERHRLKVNLDALKPDPETKAKRKAKAQAKSAELVIKRPNKSDVAIPDKDDPAYEVRVAAEEIILSAKRARAAQVDLGPIGGDGQYGSSFLVDGVRQPGRTMPAQEAAAIIAFWKDAAGLDPQDRRRKLTGDTTLVQFDRPSKTRVTASGSSQGMRLTMVFEPEEAVRRKPGELGLLEPQMGELKKIVTERQGVVLLAAPPDNGRTTLLYTIIKMHDAYTSNVQTIEIEQQDAIEGVRQNVFNPADEAQEYSKLTRSTLRRDPDVVGIAELPDAETAKEIARADHDRTRTYVSVRADSALSAIQLWMKAVGEPSEAAGGLRGVVACRLIRKLCENCRVPYAPSKEMLAKLGLPADKVQQLHKKGGQVLIKNKPETCPVCEGAGYQGQTGLFEVYTLDASDRKLIAAADFQGLRAQLRKKQLPGIQQAALMKAVEGVTSLEEVTRVTAGGAAPKKPGAGGAKPAAAPV